MSFEQSLNMEHQSNEEIDILLFCRDDTYSYARKISLAAMIEGFQTWSAFATFLEEEGKEAAQKALEDIKNK